MHHLLLSSLTHATLSLKSDPLVISYVVKETLPSGISLDVRVTGVAPVNNLTVCVGSSHATVHSNASEINLTGTSVLPLTTTGATYEHKIQLISPN